MRSAKPTGWTGRIEGPVAPQAHQQPTSPIPQHPHRHSPQEPRHDPIEDTNPSGLYKFDLGMVPASVTPPPSWRRAAWFAVASSAATLGGLMFATAAMMGSNTASIQGLEVPNMPRGGEYPPLPATGNHVPTAKPTDSMSLEQRPSHPTTTPPEPNQSDGAGAPGAAPPRTSAPDSTGPPATTPDGESPSLPGEHLIPGQELPIREIPGYELPDYEVPGGELSGDEPSGGVSSGDGSSVGVPSGAGTPGDGSFSGESLGGESSGKTPAGGESSGGEPSGSTSPSRSTEAFGITNVLITGNKAIRQRTQQYFTAVSRGDLRNAYAMTAGELRAEGYAGFATRYADASSIEVVDSSAQDESTVTTLRLTREDGTVLTQRRELEFTTDKTPMIVADTPVS
ncbi:hypothetical protein [Haloactinomyces albus]|uniref:Uncharacterized protein n=1 Tax=Haloactinomyces albus TaxID=1352928 RepID=A0AAE3ZG15_9ACTN|nr:hypothetical protein [Haloactinomyces albus]MDR7302572.1 hypothetical protein [Haloactinomyces albus]